MHFASCMCKSLSESSAASCFGVLRIPACAVENIDHDVLACENRTHKTAMPQAAREVKYVARVACVTCVNRVARHPAQAEYLPKRGSQCGGCLTQPAHAVRRIPLSKSDTIATRSTISHPLDSKPHASLQLAPASAVVPHKRHFLSRECSCPAQTVGSGVRCVVRGVVWYCGGEERDGTCPSRNGPARCCGEHRQHWSRRQMGPSITISSKLTQCI